MLRCSTLIAILLAALPGLAQDNQAADKPKAQRSSENQRSGKVSLQRNEPRMPAAKRPASPKNSPKNKKDINKKDFAVTPEREAAVNEFVQEHHPELAELLKHLKEKKKTRQYERAIRDLYAVSERLSGLKKADSQRYEPELKAWKLKSRIQLLSARLTMGDNEELKQELKQALAQQYDVRRELLAMEQQRLSDRLQKIEQDLSDYDARREATLEKQFEQLTSIRTKATKKTTKNK